MGTTVVIAGTATTIGRAIELTEDAIQNPPLAGIASATSGANVGSGAGVFRDKTRVTLNLRSIVAGMGVNVAQTADEIEISAAGGASPWQEMVGVISQINTGSQVVMGAAAVVGAEQVRVVGDLRVDAGSVQASAIQPAAAGTLAVGGTPATAIEVGSLADNPTTNFLGNGQVDFGGAVVGASSGTFPTSVITRSVLPDIATTLNVGDTPATKIEVGSLAANPETEFLGTGDLTLSSQQRFNQRVGDPAAVGGAVYAYAKDVAGTAEYFLRTPTGPVQVTSVGGLVGAADIPLADNLSAAFLVHEGVNEYIRVNTNNGSERLILGDGTRTWATFGVNNATFGPTTGSVTFGFNVSDNNNAWQVNRIGGGGTAWVRLSAIGVGAWIFGDNVLKPRMEFNITDNALSPWVVMDGATREYQRIVTTNGSERQDFGNATTNPDTNFLGSGIFSIAGVRMANGAQIGATVEPDFTLDTPVTIDRTLLTSGVATIVNNNEVLATLLTALAAKGIVSLTP